MTKLYKTKIKDGDIVRINLYFTKEIGKSVQDNAAKLGLTLAAYIRMITIKEIHKQETIN